jgi:hypothetical protein
MFPETLHLGVQQCNFTQYCTLKSIYTSIRQEQASNDEILKAKLYTLVVHASTMQTKVITIHKFGQICYVQNMPKM